MKELVFHVGRLWLLLSSVGLICNVQLSEDGESASICVIWIPITVSTSFIHQPHNSQRRSCSFFLVHFVFSCSSNGSMKQHQLNVHYSGNQYSAALVKNQGNMSWFAHVVFQLRKLCVCWLIGKKILIKGRFHCFLHPGAGPAMGIESSNPRWSALHFNYIPHWDRCCYGSELKSKLLLLALPPGGSSDVPPVISIITRDTSATPALQRARTNPDQKNLTSPSSSSSSCLSAHIHSHTWRQSPLGIMIMKEMQCVAVGGVGGVCATRQLWC